MLKLDLVLLRRRLLVIMDLVGGLGLKLSLELLRWVGLGSRLGVPDARGLSVPCTFNQLSAFAYQKIGRWERKLIIDIDHKNHTLVPPHSKQKLDKMHSSNDEPKQKNS